jgi:hypothetical protein
VSAEFEQAERETDTAWRSVCEALATVERASGRWRRGALVLVVLLAVLEAVSLARLVRSDEENAARASTRSGSLKPH